MCRICHLIYFSNLLLLPFCKQLLLTLLHHFWTFRIDEGRYQQVLDCHHKFVIDSCTQMFLVHKSRDVIFTPKHRCNNRGQILVKVLFSNTCDSCCRLRWWTHALLLMATLMSVWPYKHGCRSAAHHQSAGSSLLTSVLCQITSSKLL